MMSTFMRSQDRNRPLRIKIPSMVLYFSCIFQLGWTQSGLPFWVGTDKASITPTSEAFIAGHSHNRIFLGVNDDIYVKAFVMANASDTMAILTFDCIGLLHPELVKIRSMVKSSFPAFPIDNIAMTSTHTHSGPDVVGIWGKDITSSGVDSVYMEELVRTSHDVLLNAWKNRVQAKAEYAVAEHGVDWVFNISQPYELDRSLTTLRFTDTAGRNVATLVNFACHPTFLDAVNDQVSSDYVGGYYQAMSEVQEGEHFFLQGAIGGWVQPEYEQKTAKQAFFRGRQLARKALTSLEEAEPIKGSKISFHSTYFKLPVENPGFLALSQMDVIKRDFTDSTTTEVAFFTIGNAAFATHPGETVPELSFRTKKLMSNDGPRFVIGLGMDALGYILKPEFFDPEQNIPHSPYLCSVSLGVKTQEMVYNVLKGLISSLNFVD